MTRYTHLATDELRKLLSRAKAEEWGNADAIEAELASRTDAAVVVTEGPADPRAKMSVAEREMDAILAAQLRAGEIVAYAYEDVKVRVGEMRCWFLVDFAVWHLDGSVQMIETKGRRHWDDARVKFMAAAKLYPHWRWTWMGWDTKARAFTAKHDYPVRRAA